MGSFRKPLAMRRDGGRVNIQWVPEAAAQSFKEGEFVYLASGKATACASDATAIYGLALKDASGVTDALIPVAVADNLNEFEMSVFHGTPASAVTAITQVGSKFALEVVSNEHSVDISNTTDLAFQVQAISAKDEIGETYGRVIVKVLSDISQLGPGEKTA
jgi:hypothetical protein